MYNWCSITTDATITDNDTRLDHTEWPVG